MPLGEDYQGAVEIQFCRYGQHWDAGSRRSNRCLFPGALTKAYPWAHLDIAGTAWKGGTAKGATGARCHCCRSFNRSSE